MKILELFFSDFFFAHYSLNAMIRKISFVVKKYVLGIKLKRVSAKQRCRLSAAFCSSNP